MPYKLSEERLGYTSALGALANERMCSHIGMGRSAVFVLFVLYKVNRSRRGSWNLSVEEKWNNTELPHYSTSRHPRCSSPFIGGQSTLPVQPPLVAKPFDRFATAQNNRVGRLNCRTGPNFSCQTHPLEMVRRHRAEPRKGKWRGNFRFWARAKGRHCRHCSNIDRE